MDDLILEASNQDVDFAKVGKNFACLKKLILYGPWWKDDDRTVTELSKVLDGLTNLQHFTSVDEIELFWGNDDEKDFYSLESSSICCKKIFSVMPWIESFR